MPFAAPTSRFHAAAAAALALAMTATVGTALAFQHIGGYLPCKLCLEQRTPYYVAIPVMIVALLASLMKAPPVIVRGLLVVGAVIMTWSLYLAIFHAGVEWSWWAGPTDCGVVAPASTGGNLLDALDSVIPPSCDEAAGRFLGLSFAGWNAIASLALAGFAYYASLVRGR